MNEFHERCMEIAKRFLQTVVIVDDKAYIRKPAQPPRRPVPPNRRTLAQASEGESGERGGEDDHSLDAGTLVESFSKQGLICAVVAPRPGTDPSSIVAPSVKRTDIVILDWRINDDSGRNTLLILENILMDDDGERLRLIAIYTAQQNISKIGLDIIEKFSESRCAFNKDHDDHVELSYRHCRIVIYAKSDIPVVPALKDRSVSESDLPEKLIGDFASMTQGLLPNIALMSFAAIRENVHKVLDRFNAKLDPALLTHRACLPAPDDSQQHMVSQLASELYALMDDAVATHEPAGMEVIKDWLDFSLGPDAPLSLGENKVASRDETIVLLESGWDKKKPHTMKKNDFLFLTKGFLNNGDTDHQLDCQMAWMFNFRTVPSVTLPMLRLGSVLSRDDDKEFFLCMRPRCDSVRLEEETTFLFLPLRKCRGNSIPIVLRAGDDEYKCVEVCTETSLWSLVRFEPDQDRESVLAKRNDAGFHFTDVCGQQFDWFGELKMEFAQRIVQEFASGLSRVAVIESEWLRRKARRR